MLRKISAFALAITLSATAFGQTDPNVIYRAAGAGTTDADIMVTPLQAGVEVDVLLDTAGQAGGANGWTFALCHDGADVTLLDVVSPDGFAGIGLALPPTATPTPIFAFVSDMVFDDGAGGGLDGFFSAVIVDLFLANTVVPTANAIVARATYDVLLDADNQSTALTFCDDQLSTPPINIDVIINQNPVVPTIENATISTPVVAAGSFDWTIDVADTDVMTPEIEVPESADFIAEVVFEDTNAMLNVVEGFAVSISNQGNVTPISAAAAGSVAGLNGGAGPDFFGPNIVAGGITVGVVFDTGSVETLTFPVAEAVLEITYSPADVAADETSDLDYAALGTPTVNNEYSSMGGFTFNPDSTTGIQITILDQAASTAIFSRGECNQAGDYDLGDGIFLLLSINGLGAAPACPDSCDFNADGSLTVMDAVDSFAYLFTGGAAPAAPFPACADGTLLVDPNCSFDPMACP